MSNIRLVVQDLQKCSLFYHHLSLEYIWVSTFKHYDQGIASKEGNDEVSLRIGVTSSSVPL